MLPVGVIVVQLLLLRVVQLAILLPSTTIVVRFPSRYRPHEIEVHFPWVVVVLLEVVVVPLEVVVALVRRQPIPVNKKQCQVLFFDVEEEEVWKAVAMRTMIKKSVVANPNRLRRHRNETIDRRNVKNDESNNEIVILVNQWI